MGRVVPRRAMAARPASVWTDAHARAGATLFNEFRVPSTPSSGQQQAALGLPLPDHFEGVVAGQPIQLPCRKNSEPTDRDLNPGDERLVGADGDLGGIGRLEEGRDRLLQIVACLFDCGPLTGDVQFRADVKVLAPLTLDDCRRLHRACHGRDLRKWTPHGLAPRVARPHSRGYPSAGSRTARTAGSGVMPGSSLTCPRREDNGGNPGSPFSLSLASIDDRWHDRGTSSSPF